MLLTVCDRGYQMPNALDYLQGTVHSILCAVDWANRPF